LGNFQNKNVVASKASTDTSVNKTNKLYKRWKVKGN